MKILFLLISTLVCETHSTIPPLALNANLISKLKFQIEWSHLPLKVRGENTRGLNFKKDFCLEHRRANRWRIKERYNAFPVHYILSGIPYNMLRH